MTMQLRTETLNAKGVLVLDSANTVFLISASGTINLYLQQYGANENFPGIPPGTRIERVKNWAANSQFTGAAGTVIIFFYGIESHREDQTTFDIATVTGVIPTGYPSASTGGINDQADIAIAGGATQTVIAANASRKFVRIGSLSTNAPSSNPPVSLRVRLSGKIVGGTEIQAGTSYDFPETSALDVYNGDASAQTVWVQEFV